MAQNYLADLQAELHKEFPGWRIVFSGSYGHPWRRMGLASEKWETAVSVPFPEDIEKRGENVYRALFAVLLEMLRKQSAHGGAALTV